MPAPKISFFANPKSPHVRHWEAVLARCGFQVKTYGIPTNSKGKELVSEFFYIAPRLLKIFPLPIRYIIAGIYLRIEKLSGKNFPFVHAHNTSGYGLMAMLSGAPYGITTYGSEIYEAPQRGWLYKKTIGIILRKALFITSSSNQMTEALISNFRIDRERISEFSLGITDTFYYSEEAREKTRTDLSIPPTARVWVANRRIHPLYKTIELIKAFREFSSNDPLLVLILLQGDSDNTYLSAVETEIANCQNIRIIHDFLNQTSLRNILCASDLSISIPTTDQLSSSLLEGMACRALPIINDIPAYDPIGPIGIRVNANSSNTVTLLRKIFEETAAIPPEDLDARKDAASNFVRKNFSIDSAAKITKKLYESVLIPI